MGISKLHERFSNSIINWLMRDSKPRDFSLSDFERIKYEVRPCDVLLIEGRNRVSEVIKIITQSAWSHAAVYIGRLHDIDDITLRQHVEEHYHGNPESQLVIESLLGQGTIVSEIENYKLDHIRICRPKGLSRQDAQKVVSYVICRLGLQYDVRQILDLARYMFPWSILPRHLRSTLFKYHPGRATRQICSTLLAEAFTAVNFPILPLVKRDAQKGLQFIHRNPRLCTPSDFDYSPYFEIIKYPLFELTGHTIYRNLPWDKSGTLSNDEVGLYLPMDGDKSESIAEKMIEEVTTKIKAKKKKVKKTEPQDHEQTNLDTFVALLPPSSIKTEQMSANKILPSASDDDIANDRATD